MKPTLRKNMSKEPVTIGPQVTIREAQEVMQIWGMRHLPVADYENKLVGMLSDHDIDKMLAAGKNGSVPVSEAMTAKPYAVEAHATIAEVAAVMADRKIGSVVIIDENHRVRGIFTTTDALKILSQVLHSPDDSEFKLLRIEEYILKSKAG